MANLPRRLILEDGCYFHMTWQCHNKSYYFKKNAFKEYYYRLLLKYHKKYQISVYSYCIMNTHFHMVGQCSTQQNLSDFVKVVNSSFAKFFNKKTSRRGQVCMDRFKSPMIQTDSDLLRVMRYLDNNPVKAGIIKNPKDYQYSSYRYYAFGEADSLITDSPAYLELADTPYERQKIYREMVLAIIDNAELFNQTENYSTAYFIGSPEWVSVQYLRIKNRTSSSRGSPSEHGNWHQLTS